MENDLFPSGTSSVMDGYATLRIDAAMCPEALGQDMQGFMFMRWMAEITRFNVEVACHGAKAYGAPGTFKTFVAPEMPTSYWSRTGDLCSGVPVWEPNRKHPLGKWIADVIARMSPLVPPEVLDAILRRHGIPCGREPAPQALEIEGGWAVLVQLAKKSSITVPGVSRDDSLVALWQPSRS